MAIDYIDLSIQEVSYETVKDLYTIKVQMEGSNNIFWSYVHKINASLLEEQHYQGFPTYKEKLFHAIAPDAAYQLSKTLHLNIATEIEQGINKLALLSDIGGSYRIIINPDIEKTEPDLSLLNSFSFLADKLPGMRHKLVCPGLGKDQSVITCILDRPVELRLLIMHLNDHHKWSREQIADWLDKLYADGVDLAFKDSSIEEL